MSHLTKVGISITSKDIKYLKKAVEMFGGTFNENASSFRTYGSNSKCDHSITIKDASYQIGVVKDKDSSYHLEMDNYSPGGLEQKVGRNASKLVQRMGAEKAKALARAKGYTVKETYDKESDEIVLKMVVN